ncbi:uncharacterized protein LOC108632828 isoform X2 [Ceratina calcarata]|uniref:Uncharacterized protein LOC108632828 isoform X2 n=1 Tax=Ceratina calcarata TaxID=156304 RepID=A0AAJ7JGU8_9HYME|nr:uncharacterized protein LOC108632828 isoform X2 [Ceratina calcarata]
MSEIHLNSDLDLEEIEEELLLQEIRDQELPASAYSRPEDIQNFDIAGSSTGEQFGSQPLKLDSPGVHSTDHSWDSHPNYRGNYGYGDHHGSSSNALAWPRASHLVLYCDIQGHLKTAIGLIRLLLLISSAACLATLCSAGTAKVSLFMLPLVGRLRFMIFIAVFCCLITSLLLFLDISHVIYVFPLNWAKLNAWIFTGIGLSYALSSALLACSVWEYHSGGWVPRRTRSQLSAAAALGLSCAIIAFLLSWIHGRSESTCRNPDSRVITPTPLYKPVDNSSSSGVTLKERSPKRSSSGVVKNHNHTRYKQSGNGQEERRRRRRDGDSSSTCDGNLINDSSIQVTQNGFHCEMECTTSNSMEKVVEIAMNRTAMWTGQWQPPPDDVQPCSSKTIDPYSFA